MTFHANFHLWRQLHEMSNVFSGKNKKNISKCPLKCLPRMPRVIVGFLISVVRKLPPQPNEKHKNVKFNAQPGETKPPSKEEEEGKYT